MDQLPPELISHIFVLGAYADGVDTNSGIAYEDRVRVSPCVAYSYIFPRTIASVNRRWRQIALATSELWSKICISDDDLEDDDGGEQFCAARMFLARSGNFPLDVLIDARDPEWDFSEFDPSTAGSTPHYDDDGCGMEYKHPFTLTHMQTALDIVFPHLHRIRSLAVLSDRWAPMQMTLNYLCSGYSYSGTPGPDTPRAPLLESLVLMRCNEFVSYAQEFVPEEFAGPAMLPFSNGDDVRDGVAAALPRLKRLILSGVHLDWTRLPMLLPEPSQIEVLELSYLCHAVRPNVDEVRRLISRCANLREVTIKVSGPVKQEHSETDEVKAMHHDDGSSLRLSRLEKLTLAFDETSQALALLRLVSAPSLRNFTLADASSALAEHDEDATLVLDRCAQVPASPEIKLSVCSQKSKPQAMFPQLESLELSNLKASEDAFQKLYTSLPQLRSLTLASTPPCSVQALRPSRPLDPVQTCPAPLLNQLVVRDYDLSMDPTLLDMLSERTEYGVIVHDVRLEPQGSSVDPAIGGVEDTSGVEYEMHGFPLTTPRRTAASNWHNLQYDYIGQAQHDYGLATRLASPFRLDVDRRPVAGW